MRKFRLSGSPSMLRGVGLVLATGLMTSCTQGQLIDLARTSPGTFISQADELKIGAQAHPKIVSQFGGAYENADLNAYLANIVTKLKKNSPQPDVPYQVTILNSPAVNAFAVPGGYIYLTRGLLALANNEAEIASVLAHELGHLTERHSAKRYSVALKANIITRILEVAEDDPALRRNLRLGSASLLARHSRDQEIEADRIAILITQRTGYDPYAGISFLKTMTAQNSLKNKINNTSRLVGQVDFLATHPAIGLRKIKAFSFASQLGLTPDRKKRFRKPYLTKINKLRYGNNRDQGFVRGRTYINPQQGFRFKVPPGFRIQNRKHLVVALDSDRNVMLFDSRPSSPEADLEDVLGRHFSLGRTVWNTRKTNKNGIETVSGTASYRNVDHQIFLIRKKPGKIYRFWFISSPDQTKALSRSFRQTAKSFGSLSTTDRKLAVPRKLHTITVKPDDTVARISKKMAFTEMRQQRFRVLNGLSPTATVKSGQQVKIIAN